MVSLTVAFAVANVLTPQVGQPRSGGWQSCFLMISYVFLFKYILLEGTTREFFWVVVLMECAV